MLERIQQVLVNLVRTFNIKETYIDKDDPWSGILAVEAFLIRSTTNKLKIYITRQLLLGCDMILPIKHKVYWELIRQRKQVQINKDKIYENNKIIYHD